MSDIPQVLTAELRNQLSTVSTATLAHQLQMRGIRGSFFSGLRPTHPEMRMVGRARTLRYIALREDQVQRFQRGVNAQKRAAESTEPGDVLVIEARGIPDAGTIGDIYVGRIHALGGAGVITDGALRDTPAITGIPIPVYHQSSHAATFGRYHMAYSTDDCITCAGVFVEPGDVIVGDAEGAVVIPMALVEEVTKAALAQEDVEAFAIERIAAGESTLDLFPLAESRKADYAAWRAAHGKAN